MDSKYYVTNFYVFTPLTSPEETKSELMQLAARLNLQGLVVLASEGLNGTLSAVSPISLEQAQKWLQERYQIPVERFKNSETSKRPFRHALQVRIRSEIVTIHRPDLIPQEQINESYLSPAEWEAWMQKDPSSFTLVDTRNDYEFEIGTFKGAINPDIEQFTEFGDTLENKLNVDKKKPLLIFCTGGIRCEKATLELQGRGYEKVYQLHGGILKYLEQFPNRSFEGECFIFDDRVALDQNLKTTERYVLCVHCGCPADVVIQCSLCGQSKKICADCHDKNVIQEACSKNCAHHLRRKRNLLPKKDQPLGSVVRG